MNCEEARLLLDAYIDGELTGDEKRALEDHAQACEDCRRELEAAQLLKETLAHMDDDIAVPLEAQAAWRGAVRAEARKKSVRRYARMAYAAAAALVLLLGGTAVWQNMSPADSRNAQMPTIQEAQMSASNADLIARDGVQPIAARSAGIPEHIYNAWKKIASDDPVAAKQELAVLAEEYSGSFTQEGEQICRVELPYEYMEDFLSAASRVGEELFLEIFQEQSKEEAESAVIMIQFCEE